MMKQQGCEKVQSSDIMLSYASTLLKDFRKINNNNILLLPAEVISDYSLNKSPTVGWVK